MTNKEKALEIITYITVPSAMIILTPLLGKWLDSIIFKTDYIFIQNPFLLFIGVLITLTGIILALWTIILFKKIGKGTPNPKIPPKKLVIKGPYKWVRNPMALGGAMILFGEVILYYSLFILIFSILYLIMIYLQIVFLEEPQLKKRFGKPYIDYLKKVPRIFPL